MEQYSNVVFEQVETRIQLFELLPDNIYCHEKTPAGRQTRLPIGVILSSDFSTTIERAKHKVFPTEHQVEDEWERWQWGATC